MSGCCVSGGCGSMNFRPLCCRSPGRCCGFDTATQAALQTRDEAAEPAEHRGGVFGSKCGDVVVVVG